MGRYILDYTSSTASKLRFPSSGDATTWSTLLHVHLLPAFVAIVTRAPWIRRRLWHTISQLHITYPGSPLTSGNSTQHPRPGERVPDTRLPDGHGWLHHRLDGPWFHLLICDTPPPQLHLTARHQDLVTVHHLPAGTFGGGHILVRPDGYVAYRATGDMRGLETYLARLLPGPPARV